MLPGGVRAGVARGCQSWCCQGVSELVLPGGVRAGVAIFGVIAGLAVSENDSDVEDSEEVSTTENISDIDVSV